MKIEELRIAIESYPQRLSKAMEEVAKAERTIEKLEEQIAEEEARLSPQEGLNEDAQTDIQETLLKLDHELALCDLECERIRGEIELEYRRNPPDGDKVTEATVAAYIRSNPQLLKAKERSLEKKLERDTANRSRRAEHTVRRTGLREVVTVTSSPKLERLREKCETARATLFVAEMNLEEVKASLLPYQLLVQLHTAGLI